MLDRLRAMISVAFAADRYATKMAQRHIVESNERVVARHGDHAPVTAAMLAFAAELDAKTKTVQL